MSDDKQAVVDDAQVSAAPDATVDKRTDDVDLDTLLAEFDTGTKKPETTTTPEPKAPAIDPLLSDRIKRVEQRLLEDDIKSATTEIFGEKKIVPRVARAWLEEIARQNPPFAQAFMNKDNNPREWKRWVRAVEKERDKDFPDPVDQEATTNDAVVAHAVRGASSTKVAAPAPKLGNMSNSEYRKHVKETLGFDPGV